MPARRSRIVVLLALAVAAAASGCASASFPGRGPAAVLRVNNEHSALAYLTIYLVPALGTPVRLGTVDLNRSRDVTLRRDQVSGTYRLWARPEGRDGFYSQEFNLREGEIWEWDLRSNQVFRTGTMSSG